MATKPDDKPRAGAEPRGGAIAPRVFYPAGIIVLAFVVFAVSMPATAEEIILSIQDRVVGYFGWYYTLIVTSFVVFSLWLGIGHFGDIKLGPDDEEPEFSRGSWFAMLFAAGMGIGLVFYGVAEPLGHFADPKPGAGQGTPEENAQESLVQTILHWGLHPWAIYVVVGLAVAYMVHRKKRSISIRWTLQPLLGNRVKGWLGDLIDIAAIVGTLFGVATSLGLGVLQITAGLTFLDIIQEPSNLVYIILIGVITCFAIFSVVTGVKKGIKWLSNINISMAGALMIFVLITGPTLFIFRESVQTFGLYLQNILQLSFDTTAMQGDDGVAWQGANATYYWGWWISWAPFVGVFIARISRGRTIREFVAGVLGVPTVVGLLWFTVFGGSALARELFGEGGLISSDGSVDPEGSLFGLLGDLPAGTFVVGGTIILIGLFFVTSSDSGSLVIDMLASGGNTEPPTWSRVFWSVMEGAVAIALLLAGGLVALQTMAIVIALPFSVVIVFMCVSIYKELSRERKTMLRIQRRMQRQELTEHVTESLIDEGLVEPNADDAPANGGSGSGRHSSS
ncbi:choline/glycine/proline betaine transport protein [Tamaricihabitans halophyticus]|uniref:Choline/glycine/proline betaine transport protein n=1 Tax=Tamaricihabitans halophyticus TaxID=1262583 RepID=A0A4R2R5A0_9PSEU|nr:BCCT family transporter [Tamaricihabitans halophyticus]TCP57144.1 choline/glycine/proline betaine transport protein [Tamaricihabitans halophyticus]